MGTQLQEADLTLDDFNNLEGCNEILNETRPDVIETIHRAYFEAGADAVETNTFGCNLSNLGDYDIADRIRDLSHRGTAIARRVADELTTPDRKRYVLGSMGPGTKLPTLGHTEYAVIRDAYAEAALGILETNTFGCNLSNLGDYDIADRIRDLSHRGTAIARRVADELTTPDRKRYVLGSMGPGTKLPTLGHTEYAVIRDAYAEAALGML